MQIRKARMLSRKKKLLRAGIPEGRRPGFGKKMHFRKVRMLSRKKKFFRAGIPEAHEPRGTNGAAEVVTSHPQTAKTKQPT